MRRGSIGLALCGVMLSAATIAAQELPVDFAKARQLFADKQYRASAQELRIASSAFRGEIGKCKNATVGEKMMATEEQIDKLAAAVAAGKVESLKAFEAKLTEFDLVLAKNHQQLAADEWAKSRGRALYAIGSDLGLAAQFLKRATDWKHMPRTPDVQKAVDDALRLSQAIAAGDGEKEPSGGGQVIDALGRAITGVKPDAAAP